MTGEHYVIVGYVIGLVLLWGYALSLWLGLRRMSKTQLGESSDSGVAS